MLSFLLALTLTGALGEVLNVPENNVSIRSLNKNADTANLMYFIANFIVLFETANFSFFFVTVKVLEFTVEQ